MTMQECSVALKRKKIVVVPHFSARLVECPRHTGRIASWCKVNHIKEIFLVGGDTLLPLNYKSSIDFLRDFLEHNSGVEKIGFPIYPDGHAYIANHILNADILEKQTLLANAGIAGMVSTQLCFDPKIITTFIQMQRKSGMTLPFNIGFAGIVPLTHLIKIGLAIGLFPAIHYLKNNLGTVHDLAIKNYNPTTFIASLDQEIRETNLCVNDINGFHAFTFNSTLLTTAWLQRVLETHISNNREVPISAK